MFDRVYGVGRVFSHLIFWKFWAHIFQFGWIVLDGVEVKIPAQKPNVRSAHFFSNKFLIPSPIGARYLQTP